MKKLVIALACLVLAGCNHIAHLKTEADLKAYGMENYETFMGGKYPTPPDGPRDNFWIMLIPFSSTTTQCRNVESSACITYDKHFETVRDCVEYRGMNTIILPEEDPTKALFHEMAHNNCVLTGNHEIVEWWTDPELLNTPWYTPEEE